MRSPRPVRSEVRSKSRGFDSGRNRLGPSNGQKGNGSASTHLREANGSNGYFAARAAFQQTRAERFPVWKRALDVTCVLVTAPVWLPLMLLIMTVIRVSSPGPIFYRQKRVGHRRRVFMLFKFRTMHVNAETSTHENYFAELIRSDSPMTKLDHEGDARVFPGARFLRASGLDELPQIVNVLRGEMSLVGPRPCLPAEFDRYEEWQKRRADAPPGLTGYWQVNGKNTTTFKKMIEMDLFYAREMSPWLDLTIMAKTIPVLLRQANRSFGSRLFKREVQATNLTPAISRSRNGSTNHE